MIHRFAEWFASTGGGQQRLTDAVAAAGVTSPFWLEALEQTSLLATLALPILGAIWLIARMAVWGWRGGRGHE